MLINSKLFGKGYFDGSMSEVDDVLQFQEQQWKNNLLDYEILLF